MAEDKVLQSKEELGLKIESSSGMSESSVPEVQEKLDLVDELSSVSLDIEKCQVVFKKESDVAGHKSTVTKEAKVEAADGKQDHPDQSSSDEGKDEDLSAGIIKESEIGTSTGDKVSGIQVKLDFGDELSSVTKEAQVEAGEGNQDLTDNSSLAADKSEASSSDNGVDFNASLSITATSEGKDSANQEKVNLEDELLSGQFGFKKESDDDDGKSTAQEKSQVFSSGKSKDLEIGKSTATSEDKVKAIQEKLDLDDKHSSVGKEDNMAADENLAAADNGSPIIKETQVEAAEGNEDFPFNNSSVTKEAQVEEAEGNQDLTDNSSLAADKSEASSSGNGVDCSASLFIAATSGGKDSANQEKVNLEDDELLSGQFGFKKESDDGNGISTQGWIQGSLPDFRNSLKFFPT